MFGHHAYHDVDQHIWRQVVQEAGLALHAYVVSNRTVSLLAVRGSSGGVGRRHWVGPGLTLAADSQPLDYHSLPYYVIT